MAGTEARAWLTGTPEDPIINLDIPAGPKGEPGGWTLGANLGSSHLDTVTVPGLYYQSSTGQITRENGYPDLVDTNGSARGVLEVVSWAGSTGTTIQRYTTIGTGFVAGHVQRPRITNTRTYQVTVGWSAWTMTAHQSVSTDANGFKTFNAFDPLSNSETPLSGPGGLTDGMSLGTVDLNLVTTPGIYKQNTGGRVTTSNSYPRNGDAGILTVMQWGGVGEVTQQYTTYPNQSVTVANFGIYTRGSRGGKWSPWQHCPTQRVDNTAGKAVYTWDDGASREQLIYGNTGVLNITSLASGLNTAADGGGDPSILLYREGSTVTLTFENCKPSANGDWTIFPGLPLGFRPRLRNPQRYFMLASSNMTVAAKSMFFYTSGAMNIFGAATTDVYRQVLAYPTADPWPTVLPGTSL